ncbi:MAG: long-chain fatty acid--CoA ligase [Vulcanimicrobiota bacterium]
MSRFDSTYDPVPLKRWAESAPIKTLPGLMARAVAEHGDVPFLGWKEGKGYLYHTYRETLREAEQFAAALIELGVEPKDRVALMSSNRPEWVITDIGAMQAAAINVPLYPTLSEQAVEYILNDSAARVAVAATADHARKILAAEADDLEVLVCMEGIDGLGSDKRLFDWTGFLTFGAGLLETHRPEIERRIAAIEATDVCSLVYTSGTTGDPKGAMLMHGNFVSNCTAVLDHLGITPGEVQLSFLPLSHVFERVVYYTMMASGATICYAQSIETVRDDILEVRPHLMPAVPRLYEKIHAGVMARLAAGSSARQQVFTGAMEVGKKYFDARCQGKVPRALKLAYAMAFKLALKKIHQAMGGRMRHLISGGAPLRVDVGEFFLHAGFSLIEGYGLTETSPGITFNPPDRPKIGTVGKCLEHVEVKIADDGEILSRGPNTMLGYFNNLEATRAVIDDDGWFATGDVGELDSDGYLRITDRKKEILVMSNGKNVAPAPIEQALKSSPYIEQAVLIGDNRKFISALVVPSFASLESFIKDRQLPAEPEQLVEHETLRGFLLEECQRVLREFSNYEQVKKIALLPRELTQETGELTPKLSVKRRVVAEKFADQIEGLYATE